MNAVIIVSHLRGLSKVLFLELLASKASKPKVLQAER
jgi:hypothetical protein